MSRSQEIDGVVTSDRPAPIAVDSHLWDLRAVPAILERDASWWRGLQKAAGSADDLVGGAVARVVGSGWSGQTAESYHRHQRKVTGELDHLAGHAGTAADLLEEIAGMLRANQELLTREAEKLSGIPSSQGTQLTFHPADQGQWELVREAISAAEQIRSRVDEKLNQKRGQLQSVQAAFARIVDNWKPRTIGMLDMNIGMGYENSPWNSGGTDHGDISGLAQIIADKDVDVVTMQEVEGREAENLERELEARTGEKWTVHFGETKKSVYWSDGPLPRGTHVPFGNAIAVREGEVIESSKYVANHDLTAPGDRIETPKGEVTDGDARKAVEVEITLNGG